MFLQTGYSIITPDIVLLYLDAEPGVLGELVLAVVHVEPDLPQHPLDAGVVPDIVLLYRI